MIRVAVVNCDPIFAYGVCRLVDDEPGMRVAESGAPASLPLLSDVFLVGVRGWAPDRLAEFVGRAGRIAPVLLIADQGTDPELVGKCRAANVSGVIARTVSARALLEAIRALAAGRVITGSDDYVADTGDAEADSVLSNRERQVLHQIAQGMTHAQIATAIGISPHTVDTYVRRIRSKLGVRNKAELTRAAVLHRGDRTEAS
jgi:DNA-binding NarL/FixJ family response regulator